MPKQLEVRLTGDDVRQIESWASLWADLLHVDMTLLARRGLESSPANAFARRSLWEGAVIAYGRTAKSGRRNVLLRDVLTTQGSEAKQCHDEVLDWRDKHIAHRVDERREATSTHAIIDPSRSGDFVVEVRILPTTDPDLATPELVPAFERHVKALRDAVWAQHLRPLEHGIRETICTQFDELLARATPMKPGTSRDLSLTIHPSGGSVP